MTQPKCFKVWFADGSEVEGNTRQAWERSAQENVVCVAQKGGHFPMGGDYYWMDEDGIINSENAGRALARRFGTSVDGLDAIREIKQGVTVGFNEWKRLQGEAMRWAQGDCGCGNKGI